MGLTVHFMLCAGHFSAVAPAAFNITFDKVSSEWIYNVSAIANALPAATTVVI
jgi:hypothetical protein